MPESRESGETLIELIFAITIMATAGVVFMAGLATAALSANIQTSSAEANALVSSLGERATAVPFIACATPDDYNGELADPPPGGDTQPSVPPGYDVKVTNVVYWDGTAYTASCPADGRIQVQRLDLLATGRKGVQRTLVLTKRGPLHIPTMTAHAADASESIASPPVTLSDTASVVGGKSPTGTITFQLFGPDQFDAGVCTGPALFTSTKVINGNEPVTSDETAVTDAGTYRWIASYSGDALNQATTGVCDQAGQRTVVAPGLTFEGAPSPANVGESLVGKATLAGTTVPTGTMTFHLFAPGDTTCSAPLTVPDGSAVTVGDNTTTSGAYVPEDSGVYRWTGTYSGDVRYASVTVDCAHAGTVAVRRVPTLSLTATPTSAQLGSEISASAMLTGGMGTPGGTVTLKLYRDSSCTDPPAFASTPQSVVAGSADSGRFTPAAAGTYYWTATYSGDADNGDVSVDCAHAVAVTVT